MAGQFSSNETSGRLERTGLSQQFLSDETPLDSFPSILADLARALAVRLGAPAVPAEKEPLVDAVALAKHLNTPTSWVRTETRAQRIPHLKLGRYLRYRISDVEASLAARPKL
jgi:hypothetical protein